MYGPGILRRYLSRLHTIGKSRAQWQYHPRSDRHSKVACWGVIMDLLNGSSLLRQHVTDGKVVIGINHEMAEFGTGRKKRLDLVVARSRSQSEITAPSKTFAGLADEYEIELSAEEQGVLNQLPPFYVAPQVGSSAIQIALEAKACMTEHGKARPRLYDELNSSHLCIHGASTRALAIAYVQINASDIFISPTNQGGATTGVRTNRHRQPQDIVRVLEKVTELPRRSGNSDRGFDGLGVTVLDMRNDGSEVQLVEEPPAPLPTDPFHYGGMIIRMANEYDATFRHI